MTTSDYLLPNILTVTCWITEMVAFLTSYMIESRSLKYLHDGIFHRCVYPNQAREAHYKCLWWSSDMFSTDPSRK